MLKPRRQSISTGNRAKVGPMHHKLAQRALVVTKDTMMGHYIANALSLSVSLVEFATSGFDALKKISSTAPYTILITDLLIDEISGIALGIALKEKQTAFVLGINNGSETCKAVAVEKGFDIVVDSESAAAAVDQCFQLRDFLPGSSNGLRPYSFIGR